MRTKYAKVVPAFSAFYAVLTASVCKIIVFYIGVVLPAEWLLCTFFSSAGSMLRLSHADTNQGCSLEL